MFNSRFRSTSGMRKCRHSYLKRSLNSPLLLDTLIRSQCWWIEDWSLQCVLLITRLLWLVGRWDPVNRFNHTSWVAIVTSADRPKSVRNRCVIEVFGGVLCVVTLLFGFFCRCKGFCHRAESDLFLFSTYIKLMLILLWDPLTYLFHWGTRVLVIHNILFSLITSAKIWWKELSTTDRRCYHND